MQDSSRDLVRDRLLDEWQRDFPLTPRPFAVIAAALGIGEAEVVERLQLLKTEGAISRVGGVVRPNTIAASTLAAIAAPDFEVNAVAARLCAEPGVNHIYLRESDWNLWFVVTGPDRRYVDEALRRIAIRTQSRVLDLRLEKPYRIDLGFTLKDDAPAIDAARHADRRVAEPFLAKPGDRDLIQALTNGLPLVPEPFAELARGLGRGTADVIERLQVLTDLGVVPRIGVIVRHRAVGWRANAMVVWDVPSGDVDRAGTILSRAPGVNLCYRRRRYGQEWPYNLYCMVHAKARQDALAKIVDAEEMAGLAAHRRQILFSMRCYKQTGAMVALPKEAA